MWQIVRRARRHTGSQRTHIENLIRQEKGQVELERRQYAALRERGEPASSQLDP
jgi:hypothetical protein